MKRLLAYLVVALSLSIVSCDNEDNEVLTVSTNTVKMQNGESIIVYEDTLLNFISGDFQPEQSVPINPDAIGVLKGFSDIKMEKVWFKAKFGEWIETRGLDSKKMYYLRKDYYYQEPIQCLENEYVACYVPSATNMGFFGILPDGSYGTLGFQANVSDGYKFGCYTIIFFIGYDEDGVAVNRYVPCEPDSLVWHFCWFTKNDLFNNFK